MLPESRSALEKVVDFRGVLVHGYGIIDHEVAWSALKQDLKRLTAAARALLQPS